MHVDCHQNGSTSVPTARDTHGQNCVLRSSSLRQESLCSTSPSTYCVTHSPQPPVRHPGSIGTSAAINASRHETFSGTTIRWSLQTSQTSNLVFCGTQLPFPHSLIQEFKRHAKLPNVTPNYSPTIRAQPALHKSPRVARYNHPRSQTCRSESSERWKKQSASVMIRR